MADSPAPNRRFQFSLGTLLLGAIVIGALMGFFFTYRENSRLRAEMASLRDEVGFLEIEDPEKAYIRESQSHIYGVWRRRVYVPRAGKYRVGFQTQKISIDAIDRSIARYADFDLTRGEFILEVTPLRNGDSVPSMHIRVEQHVAGSHSSQGYTATLNWKQEDFNPNKWTELHAARYDVASKTTEFDTKKPQVFFVLAVDRSTPNSPAPSSPPESRTGLLMWLEETPPK